MTEEIRVDQNGQLDVARATDPQSTFARDAKRTPAGHCQQLLRLPNPQISRDFVRRIATPTARTRWQEAQLLTKHDELAVTHALQNSWHPWSVRQPLASQMFARLLLSRVLHTIRMVCGTPRCSTSSHRSRHVFHKPDRAKC